MTPAEVEKFQAAHHDWNGDSLEIDGVLGPKTEWSLAISRLDPRRQEIVWRACTSAGVAETTPNSGEQIDRWLRRCGAAPGQPWCAAFASWCVSVPGLPERKLAGAQALGRSMRATTLILPGDVMWFPTGGWEGHCGIIIGAGPGELAVVEGNQQNAVRLVRRLTKDVNVATPFPVEAQPGMPPDLPLVPVQREGTR